MIEQQWRISDVDVVMCSLWVSGTLVEAFECAFGLVIWWAESG